MQTTTSTTNGTDSKKRLPVLNNDVKKMDLDVDAELKAFELEQMKALGLEPGREHWRDDNPTPSPSRSGRTPPSSSRA